MAGYINCHTLPDCGICGVAVAIIKRVVLLLGVYALYRFWLYVNPFDTPPRYVMGRAERKTK